MLRATGIVLGAIILALGLWMMFKNRVRYEPPPKGNGPGLDLIDRAMQAMGGPEALRAVNSLESRSLSTTRGHRFSVHVRTRFPASYRHDVSAEGAIFSHGTDGANSWCLLDDVPVPLTDEDVANFRTQLLMLRCGLLVSLRDDPDVETAELGMRENLEWLEVEFKSGDPVAFLLGFDVESHLLRKVQFDTRMKGRLGRVPMTVELSDYRPVQDIFAPFRCTYTLDGELVAEEEVQSLLLDAEMDAAVFAPPAATPGQSSGFRLRNSDARLVLWIPARESAPDKLDKQLKTLARDLGLKQAGLAFEETAAGSTLAMGMAVQTPSQPPERPAEAEWEIRSEPPAELLTTIVRNYNAGSLAEACARLDAEAQSRGLIRIGPIRKVRWKDDLAQLQARVEPL